MICSEMTEPLPLSDHDDPAAWAQEALRRQVERLDALAQLGLELARAVAGQGAEHPAEATRSFARASRTVRMAGLLQSRLIKDMEALRRSRIVFAPLDEEEARLAAARERARLDPADGHKARVERIVERQVKARHKRDEDAVERLMQEAAERLDDDDIYGDVLNRPVGELVALICRDLGVEPDWPALAREAWAQDEIASGVAGSPFNNLERARPPSFAAANGGGGPLADPGAKPGEERVVEGAGGFHPLNSPPSRFASFFDGPS
jgi:hypothetical protein